MSQTKFAPITSSLLARKGDAVPSALPVKPSLFWARNDAPPQPVDYSVPAVRSPGSPQTAKLHKMLVAISALQFEKLGIAAVKKGVTRHQIVRIALELHLERLKRENSDCGCLATDGSCTQDCGAV